MNSHLNEVWLAIGNATVVAFSLYLFMIVIVPCFRHMVATIVCSARKTPIRAALAVLALGVLASYAGTKHPPIAPETYTIEFHTPPDIEPFEIWHCATGTVYNLPSINGCRWKSDVADRLYDNGMLVFDLAEPGKTVKMTAIRE